MKIRKELEFNEKGELIGEAYTDEKGRLLFACGTGLARDYL